MTSVPLRADPAVLIAERVTDAVELVAHGPRLVRETHSAYTAEVERYRRAYAVLSALDATGTAPAPHTLSGCGT